MARTNARRRRRRCGALALAAVVTCSLLVGTARAHISAVCSATHALRPQTATFLIATYHTARAPGAVPGSLSIKSPQGATFSFAFNSFCEIPNDGSSNKYPVPAWDLYTSVSYYRERLLLACVCNKVLDCGTYSATTGMCSSTTDDCPSINPKELQIDCYGQETDIISWVGQSWARIKGDDEKANCAYGSPAGTDFTTHARKCVTRTTHSLQARPTSIASTAVCVGGWVWVLGLVGGRQQRAAAPDQDGSELSHCAPPACRLPHAHVVVRRIRARTPRKPATITRTHARTHTRVHKHAFTVASFYVAKVTSIFSGMFELWTAGTDDNFEPSTAYLRCVVGVDSSDGGGGGGGSVVVVLVVFLGRLAAAACCCCCCCSSTHR
jgi:hypothetical protein